MDFTRFVVSLEKRLLKPLPGRPAQLKMSSQGRIQELMRFSLHNNPRLSSVLILLYPVEGITTLVLMLRPPYAGVHGGQISLPGGKQEETDESLIFTALREAKEEIGIDPRQVQIIGQLTEMFIPPSNFLVTPVVGYQAIKPAFTADPAEVDRIIEIRLKDLCDDKNIVSKKIILRDGVSLKVPSYCIGDTVIWGATAMILSEFKEIATELYSE